MVHMEQDQELLLFCPTHGRSIMGGCEVCNNYTNARRVYLDRHRNRWTQPLQIDELKKEVETKDGILALHEKQFDELYDKIEDFREIIHLLAKNY